MTSRIPTSSNAAMTAVRSRPPTTKSGTTRTIAAGFVSIRPGWAKASTSSTKRTRCGRNSPGTSPSTRATGSGISVQGAYRRRVRGIDQIVDTNTGFLRFAGDEVGVEHFVGGQGAGHLSRRRARRLSRLLRRRRRRADVHRHPGDGADASSSRPRPAPRCRRRHPRVTGLRVAQRRGRATPRGRQRLLEANDGRVAPSPREPGVRTAPSPRAEDRPRQHRPRDRVLAVPPVTGLPRDHRPDDPAIPQAPARSRRAASSQRRRARSRSHRDGERVRRPQPHDAIDRRAVRRPTVAAARLLQVYVASARLLPHWSRRAAASATSSSWPPSSSPEARLLRVAPSSPAAFFAAVFFAVSSWPEPSSPAPSSPRSSWPEPSSPAPSSPAPSWLSSSSLAPSSLAPSWLSSSWLRTSKPWCFSPWGRGFVAAVVRDDRYDNAARRRWQALISLQMQRWLEEFLADAATDADSPGAYFGAARRSRAGRHPVSAARREHGGAARSG